MKLIDDYTLISGAPFRCGDFLVYPPTLGDIRDIGYENYRGFLSLFLMSQHDIFALLDLSGDESVSDLSPIQLITIVPQLRVTLLGSLSFFLRCEVCYAPNVGFFIDDKTSLSLAQILEIRKVILSLCNIEDSTTQEPVTFANEKARRIYEKSQKGRSQLKGNKGPKEGDIELPNLIAAVSAYSPTYNLLNIWGLTVYQLYDQFARLGGKFQLDVFGHKWAAWGTDEFDFSLWYKNPSKST